ncbi:MAG TPA: hypothetical protein VFF72_09465 [Caldimonas sp.]|nr:hypothetical protein [Caldimonas sp.]
MSSSAALADRVRARLDERIRGGVRDVTLLLHSDVAGSFVVESLQRQAKGGAPLNGLPARVATLAVTDVGAVGIDLWLAAFAWGAAQVWTLVTHEDEMPSREAIARRMRVAEAILASVGLPGEHLRIIGGGEVSRLASCVAAKQGRRASPDERVDSGGDETMPAALQRLDRALQRPPAAAIARRATFTGAGSGPGLLDLAFAHLLEVAPS